MVGRAKVDRQFKVLCDRRRVLRQRCCTISLQQLSAARQGFPSILHQREAQGLNRFTDPASRDRPSPCGSRHIDGADAGIPVDGDVSRFSLDEVIPTCASPWMTSGYSLWAAELGIPENFPHLKAGAAAMKNQVLLHNFWSGTPRVLRACRPKTECRSRISCTSLKIKLPAIRCHELAMPGKGHHESGYPGRISRICRETC